MDLISHPKGSNSCKIYNIINKCQRKRKCNQEWTLATLAHKTHDEDKQNKNKAQHRKLKR